MSAPQDDGKTAQAQPQGEYMAMMREANSPETKNRNLRDWFAGMALSGIMNLKANQRSLAEHDATYCYAIADAMLEARKEQS